jgi:hypothetical protein
VAPDHRFDGQKFCEFLAERHRMVLAEGEFRCQNSKVDRAQGFWAGIKGILQMPDKLDF